VKDRDGQEVADPDPAPASSTFNGQRDGDIAVRLFQTRHDGVLFGLVDESDDDPERGHGGDWVELYPARLGFHAPWNGDHDT